MMDIGKDLQDAYECGRQDALNELLEYTYAMLTAEKFGLQHKIKSMMADHKTEPRPNADQHVQRVEYVGNDGRCRCWKCKHFEEMHETPIASDGRYYTYVVCTPSRCHYEPKDEPQTEELPPYLIRDWEGYLDDFEVEDEPQTERSE